MNIKSIIIGFLTGASTVTALLLILVAYSDRLEPSSYPLLACSGMVFPLFVIANLLFVPLWVLVKWRRTWIPVVAFVISYPAIRIYMPMNIHWKESSDEGCIKLVSYNVCGFGGNWRYENATDTVGSYLQRIDADIVCLQEDRGGKGGSGFDKLKSIYPYNDTTMIYGSKMTNAVGIHTRYPILQKEVIDYPSSTNGSVAYFLLIDGDTVIVINNHLESTHLSLADREHYRDVLKGNMEQEEAEAQMDYIIDKLSEQMITRAEQAHIVNAYVQAHSHYPVIVCGDFNDTPLSYTRHTMSQGLTDCFVEAGCGLGLSFNQKGFNFRIDHIMCSQHFTPIDCRVDGKMDASDHNPIICWLKKEDLK